jgi:hypothetical protein
MLKVSSRQRRDETNLVACFIVYEAIFLLRSRTIPKIIPAPPRKTIPPLIGATGRCDGDAVVFGFVPPPPPPPPVADLSSQPLMEVSVVNNTTHMSNNVIFFIIFFCGLVNKNIHLFNFSDHPAFELLVTGFLNLSNISEEKILSNDLLSILCMERNNSIPALLLSIDRVADISTGYFKNMGNKFVCFYSEKKCLD